MTSPRPSRSAKVSDPDAVRAAIRPGGAGLPDNTSLATIVGRISADADARADRVASTRIGIDEDHRGGSARRSGSPINSSPATDHLPGL
ncbi:hypothetical protein [Micromonospora sp. NPDC007230]|uniref:hypothetical protein n=1 Tax=Micromonospora sp. NPDC007230 TaxID=3364237 RepID=UPI0036B87882